MSNKRSKALKDMRAALDAVDKRLLDALAERQKVIGEVARLKANDDTRLRDVGREEGQLTALVDLGRTKGLDAYYVTRLFREILDQSVRYQQEFLADEQNPERKQQKSIVVAYQGTEGAYSHTAAMKQFGPRDVKAEYRGYHSFEALLSAVRDGEATYGVLPIENTTAGSINEAYDLLSRMNLHVVGEEILRIEHCLVALEDVHTNHIRRVYSHPQALAQCSNFLATLHDCTIESFTDTAMAVKKIRADQDLSQAAIAGETAAKLYGLTVIKRDIANQKDNYTRFMIVAREPVQYDTRITCKTSLILATRHEEGALLKCLNVLAQHGLNLTKLESRPRPNVPWEYLFYLDFEGNTADPDVQVAIEQLQGHTSFLRLLGSYPSRTTADSRPAAPQRGGKKAGTTPPPIPAPDASLLQALEKKPYRLVSRAHRQADTTISVGGVVVGGARSLVIAGPAAVRSAAQLHEVARAVKNAGADLLRGNCFRTQDPYSAPGLGYEGLELLSKAGQSMGLPIVTEVIDPADVARVAALADVLQIGARNMHNFQLLKEAGMVDRPILLKRGLMASIDEWLAAAECVLASGNQQVILCETGIHTFETATHRTLDLSAVPVLKERTHLPVIVDPSQACASARWVAPLAEAALAAGAHGIMVEVEASAAEGSPRREQSLAPPDFEGLMQRLTERLQ